jgi:Ca2+-binding EF-hand superfamily protein
MPVKQTTKRERRQQERKDRANMTRLQGLKSPVADLNGEPIEIVQEFIEKGQERFIVNVVGKSMQIVVGRGNLKFRGRKRMNRDVLDGNKHSELVGRNRTNVKLALVSLSTQIRTGLKNAAKRKGIDGANWRGALKKVFCEIDSNDDGELDEHEFLTGLGVLGVSLTQADIELIWPFFDLDLSGAIDFDEFCGFLNYGEGSDRATKLQMLNKMSGMLQTGLRKGKVEQKSMYRSVSNALVKDSSAIVREYMKKEGLTAKRLFELIDTDKNQDFDRAEFEECLPKIGE